MCNEQPSNTEYINNLPKAQLLKREDCPENMLGLFDLLACRNKESKTIKEQPIKVLTLIPNFNKQFTVTLDKQLPSGKMNDIMEAITKVLNHTQPIAERVKEYEILEIIADDGGIIYSPSHDLIDVCVQNNGKRINAIKRISDGEVFRVRDEIEYRMGDYYKDTTIQAFFIENNTQVAVIDNHNNASPLCHINLKIKTNVNAPTQSTNG